MSDPHDIEGRRRQHEARGQMAVSRLLDMAKLYHAVFSTDTGAKVLADLRRCYGGSTVGRDGRITEIRSAQRDVLLRIENLMTLAGVEPGVASADLLRSPAHIETTLNPWD